MKPLALISVTDKTGVIDFAKGLVDLGFELISTGGTSKAIREAGIPVKDVSDVTGFPEMLDGRVKTLHPIIHGGLLGDLRHESHVKAMAEAGIAPISVVAVNLYAFEATINKPHELDDAIENIDIGGPTMIRSAAKNCANVTVVVDPEDYSKVLEALKGGNVVDLRLGLCAKAFRHTAFYDSMVSRYLTERAGESPFAETVTVGYRQKQIFRYGENPHQNAALYEDPLGPRGIAQAEQLWGKELSYNNLGDSEGAWELVDDLPPTSCAIIKHANPCGAAVGADFGEAYRLAFSADPKSAFGGIAAFNGVVDEKAALAMTEKGNYLEVVIGTGFTDEAVQIFKERSGWGQNVRLLSAPLPGQKTSLSLRSIRGGTLIQQTDESVELPEAWKIVTKTKPSAEQIKALQLQWTVVRHVKSNAIVVGTDQRLLGVGAGQMNRVQSVELAIKQAGELAKGAVLASDAFFPFPDSVITAHEAGIAAIVQPGGSKKDDEVVAKADELGIAMCFTGIRHFRH